MKPIPIFLCVLLAGSITLYAQPLRIASPDGRLVVHWNPADEFPLRVDLADRPAVWKATMAMETNAGLFSARTTRSMSVADRWTTEVIRPVIPLKQAQITSTYREAVITLDEKMRLFIRVFNDGLAYRFSGSSDDSLTIRSETLEMEFPQGTACWFAPERSLISHYEQDFTFSRLDTLTAGSFQALPMLLTTPEGIRIWISETDQRDYPSMFLSVTPQGRLSAMFPPVVLEARPNENRGPDRNEIITRQADYIARTIGQRDFPWRVLIITSDDRQLAASTLIDQLAPPSALNNTRWIKPGKVAWDWYNACNLSGVNFRSGINTETYRYFIDFAAEYGIEYVILDEGWSLTTTRITEFRPEMDVHGLIRYGQEKGVGIILWVLWKPLMQDLENILSTYARWGVKGVKVDFMQRADQEMVRIYETIAAEAARHQLLVDFHGSFKPNGLHRKYPNVLTFEGVRGNEHNKWSQRITPRHNLTLPFTRMLAGPMDYTPGAMRNAGVKDFCISFERPMSQGTRCHQLAMYVVYESPLQMLCDAPSSYRKEPEVTRFISRIPVIWDETIVTHASVSEYLVMVRRNGNQWYIGAMTNQQARTLTLELSFLPEGKFILESMEDGINADRHPEDYQYARRTVSRGDTITLRMAPGGGYAAIIVPAGR